MIKGEIISLNNLEKQYPNCYNEFVKISGKKFISVNLAIDSLLFHFGITLIVIPIINSKNNLTMGPETFIRYLPGNILNMDPLDEQYIQDFKKYKDYDKAEKATSLRALDILEDSLALRFASRT